jgi:hypothetical protein
MKNYLILFFVLASVSLRCQDFEPSSSTFYYSSESSTFSTYLSPDSSWFQQNRFLLGVHWGPQITMGKKMLMNQRDAAQNTLSSDMVDTCDVLLKPEEYSHAVGPEILNGRGIHYDPTLPLNPNKPDSLIISPGNHSRNVFGFLKRKGWIDTTDLNYNRLIIDSASLDNQVISTPVRTSVLMENEKIHFFF